MSAETEDLTNQGQTTILADVETMRKFSDSVRGYWEETTSLYLKYGTTFQGGFVHVPGKSIDSTTNNLDLALRAGIQAGHQVLDAGCGVCGPSIDIARNIPSVHIDAVTLSPSQAVIARNHVQNAGLSKHIQVHACDYHALPFETERFDIVFFFESMYSINLPKLFTEILRVLAPGGMLYAKEVYRLENLLSPLEQAALEEFEDLFCYKVWRMSEVAEAVAKAGFDQVESKDLTPRISYLHYDKAMIENVFGFPLPTEFGRRHARKYRSAPLLFGEIKARKPF